MRNLRSIEGTFANADAVFYGRVEIATGSGCIKKFAEPLGEADLIAEKGIIFPGFVDLHIHAREDAGGTQTYKEDFESASQAALHGGVVCVADMPNNPVPPIEEKNYVAKKKLAENKPIDFLLYAAIGPNTKPLSFKVPYKVFMAPSVGGVYFENFKQLEQTIQYYRGQAVSFHCENPQMISPVSRPPEAEISAIEFALFLIKKYALQGKICHCSTEQGVEMIAAAKKQGIAVTCEVTPHHLYPPPLLPQKWRGVNPPIRDKEDRLALLSALRDGTIDYLASDHAPHTKEEKEQAPPFGSAGMPHLDTYGAFATWLMAEHDFAPQDIARVCAYNPGNFVNQFVGMGLPVFASSARSTALPELRSHGQSRPTHYGKIEEGYAASFTVIDPNLPTVVKGEDLRSKCKWSPFEGVEFPGRTLYTIHKGTILYEADLSRS